MSCQKSCYVLICVRNLDVQLSEDCVEVRLVGVACLHTNHCLAVCEAQGGALHALI